MAKEFKLEIEKREQHGKQAMKRLRNEGKIPGVFYTADSKNSTSFVMDSSQIDLAVKSGARIFNISVGGKKQIVIFKSVQYHPITDSITHVDLYGVRMDQAIVIKVPIVLNGIAVGVQNEGGILNQAATEIDVRCLPGDIPESIELDITDLKIGDSLNVGSISVADNIEIVANEDMVIVSVTVPMREEEAVESTEDTEFMDSEGDASEEDKSGAPSEESSNESKEESE